MSWISDLVQKYAVKSVLAKVANWLNGKKTAIGAVNLLLWVALYAIPAFTPQYNWITVIATQIRDGLNAAGLNLDNQLFNAGVGFTVVGLVDKIWKLFKEDNINEPKLRK